MVTTKDRCQFVSASISCVLVAIILSSCLIEAEKQTLLEALLQTVPQTQGNISNGAGGGGGGGGGGIEC